MTKKELIKALEPFDDDQIVLINLYTELYTNGGSQVIIQGVREKKPWRPGLPNLIGLLGHLHNKQLNLGEKTATRWGADNEV